MATRVKLNPAGIRRVLEVEAAPHVQRLAERVRASTTAAAGTVDGSPVVVERHDNDSPSSERYRVGLVVRHPTAQGRKAGNDAALAALKVVGE